MKISVKIFLIIISSFSLIFFSGCRTESNRKTINFTHFLEGNEAERLKSIVSEYNLNQKDIRVELQYIPFFDVKPYIIGSGAKNADIFTGVSDWQGELLKKDIIFTEFRKERYPGLRFLENYNKTTGIVRNFEFPLFFYYPERFSDKRLPGKMEDILALFGKEFLYDIKDFYYHIFIASFYGSDFLDSRGYDLENEDFLKSLDIVEKIAYTDNIESVNYDAVVNLFASGKLSIILDGQWNYERHISNGAKVLELFPERIFSGIKVYFLNSRSLNIDESMDFIEFLDSREKKYKFAEEDILKRIVPMPSFPEMQDFWKNGKSIIYRRIIKG